jgi:hypothetical protein
VAANDGTRGSSIWSFRISDYPAGIASVDTEPANLSYKDLPALFNGNFSEGPFAIVNYANVPVSVIITYTSPVILSRFESTIGGYHNIATGNYWTIQAKTSDTASYVTLVNNVPSDAGRVNIALPTSTTAYKVFKVTVTRNNGDGAVHIAQLMPRLASATNGTTVTGKVYRTSASTLLAGAYVQLCKSGGACTISTANASGQYSVSGLESGQYYVTALPPPAYPTLQPATVGPISVSGTSVTVANLILT